MTPKREPGVWLTVSEAAEQIGVHVNTLKRVKPEELPYYKLNGRGDRRYRMQDIEWFLSNRRVG